MCSKTDANSSQAPTRAKESDFCVAAWLEAFLPNCALAFVVKVSAENLDNHRNEVSDQLIAIIERFSNRAEPKFSGNP